MARKTKKYTLSRESIDMISSDVHAFLGFLMRNLDNQTDKLNTTMDDLYSVFLNAIEYSVSFLPFHRIVHCHAPYGDGNTGRPSESP